MADLDNTGFKEINSSYTDSSPASAIFDFRGVETRIQFDDNSARLKFEVPSLGISQTFDGANRNETQDKLESYLEKNGDGILTKILQQSAATTAIDPVAGNPNSLSDTMIDNSFNSSVNGFNQNDVAKANNSVGVGIATGQYQTGDYVQQTLTLPLSYTVRFDNPKYKLLLELPIHYSSVEQAEIFGLALGSALQVKIKKNWALTPGLRYGVIGSADLASAASVLATTLTSNYRIPTEGMDFNIANMLGNTSTGGSIKAGEYEIDYDLTNTVVKNGIGIEFSHNSKLINRPTSWQFNLANTQILGDEVYIDSYWDFAFSWGVDKRQLNETSWKDLRVGLTYTKGNHNFSGGSFNLGYSF